jgi:hypothetical protein
MNDKTPEGTDSPEGENAEIAKFRRGSLKARLDAAGIADAVFQSLEDGEPLRVAVDICARAGIATSPGSVLAMKRRYLGDWQAQRVAADAAREGISGENLADVVRHLLLARIGRFVHACSSLDDLKTVGQAFHDWTKGAIAERAENRAERESQRKLAMRIDALFADEAKLAAVRTAREDACHLGVDARIEAITRAVWGEWAAL